MNALDAATGDPCDTSMGFFMQDEVACNLRASLLRQGWSFEPAEMKTRAYMCQQLARDMGLAYCGRCGCALTGWLFRPAWCAACEDRARLARHEDADYGPYLAEALFDAYVERLREVARPRR